MALTTRTWYDERVELTEGDFRHRQAPARSSIVPHALASLQPRFVTDYVCRVRDGLLDDAVSTLQTYLTSRE